jgi:hypothetical protein
MKKALLDADSTSVLNGLPPDLLQRAATSTVLPQHLQPGLVLVTWVRAVLLENTDVGKALAPVLASLIPELKADFDTYRSADSQEARQFSAVFLLLKLPRARPYLREGFRQLAQPYQLDGSRDNWWDCRPGGGAVPDSIDFLNETQKAAAMKEQGPFPSVDTTFRLVITWAKEHPDDPRIPAALHRAVKSARYGCTSGELSKQAFQLLHERYPNSEWTKKTKYWYSGN